jgi:hypothetical protein
VKLAGKKYKRNPKFATADPMLDRLKAAMGQAKLQNSITTKSLQSVRNDLHELVFQEVDGPLLYSRRMLDNASGLPQLFDTAFMKGIPYPYDIRADAEELYNKWCTGQFETDLLRGIIRGKPTKVGKEKSEEDCRADRLALNPSPYRLMDPKTHGHGKLLNGAWWPTQLAAVRDGAHNHMVQGINGEVDAGVYSLVMAGGMDPKGQPYPNIDDGDVVQYCGTDSSDGKPSPSTQLLIDSTQLNPVRLIRSSKVNSSFAPELGYRYDGLYDVVSFQLMDDAKSSRQRHIFKLVRVPGQDPIRGGSGPEKRPTQQESDAYRKDKTLRGY